MSIGKRLGLFISGNFEALNRDRTTFADGFDSKIYGLTAGGDYRVTNQLLTGAAFNWSNTDGDFDGGGDFVYNSYGGIVYGVYQPIAEFFAQVSAGYARKDFAVTRTVSFREGSGTPISLGSAASDTYGNIVSAQALLGYDRAVDAFTVGLRAGFNYTNTHLQDYSESGNTGLELRYNDQYVNSVQSLLGLQGSVALSTGIGVLVPQVNAEYIHEFANSQRFINVQFVDDGNQTAFDFQNEKPVRNYFNLGLGMVAVLPRGIQPFVNFRAMVGNEQFDNYASTIGIRIER